MTDDVTVSRTSLDALLARVEQLEAQVAVLSQPAPPTPTAEPTAPAPEGPAIGRRRALVGLAGAAAAGAAAVVTPGQPAAAANGDALIIGSVGNGGTQSTGLTVSGTSAPYGFSVTDNGLTSYTGGGAIVGHAKGVNFSAALHGVGEDIGTGLLAESVNGTAITAESTNWIALTATSGTDSEYAARITNTSSTGHALKLRSHTPLVLESTGGSPPMSTTGALAGSLRWTADGLWACVAGGNPGTWRRIAHTDTAGAFTLLPTPKRVYDSRVGTTPAQGPKTPLAGGVARTIDLKHNASGVPAGATGALVTILLVNAANANGNMTMWANDKPKPQSNTMVWGGSTGRFTATAVTALDAQARVKIDASHATNIVLDVVGYYR